MDVAIGLRAFTGWAVAVALQSDRTHPRVLDRRRLALLPPDLPAEVYHAAHGLADGAAASLIRRTIEASEHSGLDALRSFLDDLRTGGPVGRAGIVVKRGPPLEPPTHARMAHAGLHASEGELYRFTILRSAEKLGLRLALVPEAYLAEDAAAAILGVAATQLRVSLRDIGSSIGPPWTSREKSTTLAAWLALSGRV